MYTSSRKPPRTAQRLISRMIDESVRYQALGDIEEQYNYICQKSGSRAGWYFYYRQIPAVLPAYLSRTLYGNLTMTRSYFTSAVRNLMRRKAYTVMTISGLALGLAVFMISLLCFNFCFSFDSFHDYADRIYGIVHVLPSAESGERHTAVSPAPLVPAMMRDFPDIEDAVGFVRSGRQIVQYGDKTLYENDIIYAGSNFLTFFTFEMIAGDPATALSEPNSVVLTETAAAKYFGGEQPLGEFLTFDNENSLKVTGILEDIPLNSSIRFDFLVSIKGADDDFILDWSRFSTTVFVRLPENYDAAGFERKFSDFIKRYLAGDPGSEPKRMYLYPLTEFHLKSLHISSSLYIDSYEQLYMAIAVAVIFLLVICFNFMILSTAGYMSRVKEVGLRKVLGSNRRKLIVQYLGESVLTAFFAVPVAILLYEIIMPPFNTYFGEQYDLSLWKSPFTLVYMLCIACAAGIVSGSYPAFFLSAFKPVQVLSGNLRSGRSGSKIRKILIISQFLAAAIFIIFSIVIHNQFGYLINLDLGYNRDRVVVVHLEGVTRSETNALKENIMQHPDIVSIAGAQILPVKWSNTQRVFPEGLEAEETCTMDVYPVDYDFIESLDMQIVQGRSFMPEFGDAAEGDRAHYIINEMAAERLSWSDPVGKELTVYNRTGLVVGVVKNFHFRNLISDIVPAVMYISEDNPRYLYVRFAHNGSATEIREYVASQWRTVLPQIPYESFMLDDYFKDRYADNDRMGYVYGVLGIITVLISCVGLLGLVSYTVERKTKEIGVRKVLGASPAVITRMFMFDFLRLLAIANLIAMPVAYLLLDWFLRYAFAYSIEIGSGVFVFTLAITLFSAAAAVLFRTVRAARANPVDSLRYE